MCSVLLPPPWSVAYKHLVDMVPAVIENEAIQGLEWNLEQTLHGGLQLTAPDAHERHT